ncbi:hypothetical protein [Mesorhizobium sp. M0618]|uniref:hypothetical protein n=1 Tax=unclassified Mesorhizobium TaxID=325217 RepID=UPI0033350B45
MGILTPHNEHRFAVIQVGVASDINERLKIYANLAIERKEIFGCFSAFRLEQNEQLNRPLYRVRQTRGVRALFDRRGTSPNRSSGLRASSSAKGDVVVRHRLLAA